MDIRWYRRLFLIGCCLQAALKFRHASESIAKVLASDDVMPENLFLAKLKSTVQSFSTSDWTKASGQMQPSPGSPSFHWSLPEDQAPLFYVACGWSVLGRTRYVCSLQRNN